MNAILKSRSTDAPGISPWLPHQVPLIWFTPVMGICGLSMVWRHVHASLGIGLIWSYALFIFATLWFVFAGVNVIVSTLRCPAGLIRDWRDPTRINSFAAFTLSLLLLATYLAPAAPRLALPLWLVGVFLHLGLTLVALHRWIHSADLPVELLGPIWFMPVVGNMLIPIAGVELGHVDLSWFSFSIGMAFWPILLGLILNRTFFHESLPEQLHPTLFILLAPPAVGFIAYLRLTGSMDRFALFLINLVLFTWLMLMTMAPRLLRRPFTMLWWSFSFPTAGATIAAFEYASATGGKIATWFAFMGAAMTTFVVLSLTAWTIRTVVVECLGSRSALKTPGSSGAVPSEPR